MTATSPTRPDAATLTDRYVHAVVRRLPPAQREDVGRELRAAIDDRVDARSEHTGLAEAERAALTELGDPARLAADYADRPHALIGPAYYFDYLRLLGLLLRVVPPIAAVFSLIGDLIDDPDAVLGAIVSAMFAAGFAAVQVCLWTTVGFAIAERAGAEASPVGGAWTPDRLRENPDRQIGLGETVVSSAGVLLGLSLLLSRFDPVVADRNGVAVPFVPPEFWDGWRWYLAAVLGAMLVVEVLTYRAARWTWPLAGANLVLNLAFGVVTIWLLLSDRLVNPAAQEAVREQLGWTRTPVNLTAVAAVLAVVLAWDSLDTFRKARHSPRTG